MVEELIVCIYYLLTKRWQMQGLASNQIPGCDPQIPSPVTATCSSTGCLHQSPLRPSQKPYPKANRFDSIRTRSCQSERQLAPDPPQTWNIPSVVTISRTLCSTDCAAEHKAGKPGLSGDASICESWLGAWILGDPT